MCNSRSYFISEKCNVPIGIQTRTNWGEISTNAVNRGGYEPTTVPITLGRGALPLHFPQLTSHHNLDEDISNTNI